MSEGAGRPALAAAALARTLRALGVLRLLALLVVAVELSTTWTTVQTVVRTGYDAFVGPHYLVRDADLDPLEYFCPTEVLSGARALIPPGASYTFLAGRAAAAQGADSCQVALVFWLLPRRYTTSLARAQWVIADGRPLRSLGVATGRAVGLAPGVRLAEVTR